MDIEIQSTESRNIMETLCMDGVGRGTSSERQTSMVQGTGRESHYDEAAGLKTFQFQGKTYLVVPEVRVGNCEFCHFQNTVCSAATTAYKTATGRANSDDRGCSVDNVIFIRPEKYETYRVRRVTNKLRGI